MRCAITHSQGVAEPWGWPATLYALKRDEEFWEPYFVHGRCEKIFFVAYKVVSTPSLLLLCPILSSPI